MSFIYFYEVIFFFLDVINDGQGRGEDKPLIDGYF